MVKPLRNKGTNKTKEFCKNSLISNKYIKKCLKAQLQTLKQRP